MKYFLISAALSSFLAAPVVAVADEDKPKNAPSTVTGCLNGPTEEGTFMLQRVKAGDVHVGGNEDLRDHVGQQVRLSGSWVGSGENIGQKESATDKVGNTLGTRKHFRVTKIEKVSDRCDVTR